MKVMPKSIPGALLALLVALSWVLSACAGNAARAQVVQADIPRQAAPVAPAGDMQTLAQGNTTFALELYQALRQSDGNLFYSPYSVSLALAMTYAGARGETAAQMARTLHFDLPQERLHPAFNALDLAVTLAPQASSADEPSLFQLHTANSLWGQQDEAFLDEFLNTLAANYGAGMHLVDFANDSEAARIAINRWVSDQTEDKIKDLIPAGELDAFTRLVLANAIYFKADWLDTFEANDTQPGAFTHLDGSQVQAPMMHQVGRFNYTQGEGYQALELPYSGGEASMVILLPDAGSFEAFESALDTALLEQALQSLQPADVQLSLPKFQYESRFNLGETLKGLGMPVAFTPPDGDGADFSGMDGQRRLFIGEVFHKAFVAVDEKGTEAAAATAVEMRVTSAPAVEVQFTVDRPFIFLIRHSGSQSILFVGRVLDPQ